MKIKDHLWFMDVALEEALKAEKKDEVPVGAVIVDQYGKIQAQTHNLKESQSDPCAHAEILAIREASLLNQSWRLTEMTLYVTLEPCLMCLGAMIQCRIGQLCFGAYDPKGGSFSLGYYLNFDQRLNHRFPVIGGLKHKNCSEILSRFFRMKRKFYAGNFS